jgi:hypothetical protein
MRHHRANLGAEAHSTPVETFLSFMGAMWEQSMARQDVWKNLALMQSASTRKSTSGNTIIENFEMHPDVAYAIILLTGDGVEKPAEPKAIRRSAARSLERDL